MREIEPGLPPEPFTASLNKPGVAREVQAQEAADAEARHAAIDWRGTIRRRVGVAALLLLCWSLAIEARLVYLQVFQRDDLVARAERQRNRTVLIPGKRGDLLDRRGRLLAYSVDGDAIFAEPTQVKDAEAVATAVCDAIEGCAPRDRQQMAERLSQRRPFAYIWRRASPADAQRVRDLRLKGVGVLREERRFYPNRELAAHVLGYVGLDNNGLGGIEASHETQIAGQPGRMLLQADAKNQAFARIQRPPTQGATLELTIDEYLQHVAERELEAGVAEFGARGGTVVIMDPQTGEILALANYPTFNPNAFQSARDELRRNRAVQELYEPGSTFKVVTASAALEEQIVRPDDIFDVSAGSIRFGSRVIEDVHRYGALTFTQVLVKSSNVGAIKVGLKVGAERLGRYVSLFGFGQPSLGELPGESRGIVWNPSAWSDSALASVSMGYQVGVTPLQMATAVSAVANGGELLKPRIVRAVIRGNQRTATPRQVLRRVISPGTAAALTTIMEQVVEAGTATKARIDGYTVAGKTGTAAKLDHGRYSKSDYNASFVGFLPSRRPVATVLVVIDSPHGKGFYGGAVAAPIFKRVAEAAMRHLGVGPTLDPGPTLLVEHRAQPPAVAPSPTPLPISGTATTSMSAGRTIADGTMPDLRGASARDALRVVSRLGLIAQMDGDGVVVDQDLPPGTPVEQGTQCRLRLDRRPAPAPAAPTPAPMP